MGLCCLALYSLRAHTYLGDDASACANCHVMRPYHATWSHSSHAARATCNDCHVPHLNAAQKWAFKATDGAGHVMAMIGGDSQQVIQANERSAGVIMDNCLRCHDALTSTMGTMVSGGYQAVTSGESAPCWHCHRDVPHGGLNSQAATPAALVPLPPGAAPKWLTDKLNH